MGRPQREIQTTLLGPDGVTNITIDGKYVTVRTNPITSLEEVIGLAIGHTGIVGDTYTPFQNESLVDYPQTMTDESGAFLDTAGSMRAGADVFITMKLPTTMLVGGVDHLDVNIAILNNHTGNRAITGLITPTRIVCANTQRAALGNAKSSFKIRHTANAGDRVQEAREQLGLTWKYVAEFEIEAEKMIQTALAEADFRKLCDDIWKPPTDTAAGRSKTIAATAARRSTSCCWMRTPTQRSAAQGGPATRPSPSTSTTRRPWPARPATTRQLPHNLSNEACAVAVVVLVGLVGCSSGSGSSPGPTVTVEHAEAEAGTVTVTRTVTAPAAATPTEASTSGAADTSATKTVKGQDGVAQSLSRGWFQRNRRSTARQPKERFCTR
ncbi:MAG: DUF945 domain-containing protein [Actinomycetota bacterium]|nr:DUF945 domain-containing protein [Actinomycetota bacterium]